MKDSTYHTSGTQVQHVGICPRGFFVLMRHRIDTSKCLYARQSCDSWKCPACRMRMAREWHNRITKHLEADEIAGRIAFVETIGSGEWSTARKRLFRAKASYASFQQESGESLLIGTTPKRLPNYVSFMEATAGVNAEIRRMGVLELETRSGKLIRPITTSQSWGATEAESEYEKIGRAKRNEREVINELDEEGIPYTKRRNGDLFVFQKKAVPVLPS